MFYELMLAMFSGFALDVLVKATLLLTSVMLIDLCLRHRFQQNSAAPPVYVGQRTRTVDSNFEESLQITNTRYGR